MSVVLYEQNNLFIGIIIQGNKLTRGKTKKERKKITRPPFTVPSQKCLCRLLSAGSLYSRQWDGERSPLSPFFPPKHDGHCFKGSRWRLLCSRDWCLLSVTFKIDFPHIKLLPRANSPLRGRDTGVLDFFLLLLRHIQLGWTKALWISVMFYGTVCQWLMNIILLCPALQRQAGRCNPDPSGTEEKK